MPTSFIFDSALADGHFTRLKIDPPNICFSSIGWYLSPTAAVFEFPFSPHPLFVIQFSRYDLQANQLYDPANPSKQDFVNYLPTPADIAQNKTQVTVDASVPPHWIVYDHVQPQHYTVNAPDALQTIDPIKVALAFSAPTGPEDSGWINLDISFSYPQQFAQNPDKFAWQAILIFPQFKINRSSVVHAFDEDTLAGEWSLLFPGGDQGKIKNVAALVVHDTPVQLAALYKTGANTGGNYLRGIALAATDTLGQAKSFIYSHVDATSDVLNCYFTSPIHLLNNPGNPLDKKYVQPVDPGDARFNFTLSRGDNYGFGGARMNYRIKAIQVEDAYPCAPLDWMDIANLYRKWVKANRPSFFGKEFSRTPNGPTDNISPFTVITNYGLDGPIAPTVNDPKLPAKWLEIHPIKVGGQTDVPNNDNVSLQDRLREIRKRVNNSYNDVRLEAQIWGYELGGYYQWIAGYPPITDVLTAPGRFRAAMDELVGNQIYPIITTDLIIPLFNRGRFKGHVIYDGSNWVEAIKYSLPSEFTDPNRNPNINPANYFITEAKIYNSPSDHSSYVQNNRVFLIKQSAGYDPQANWVDAEALAKNQQYGPYGPAQHNGALTDRFYAQYMRPLCPQDSVLNTYSDKCLAKGAFSYGARLIEFMKVGFSACYNKDHQHIFTATTGYNNVIGFGGWTVARLQQALRKIQRLGQGLDPRPDGVKDPSFALTYEGPPLEPLLPLVNEFYHRSPVLQYVYAEILSAKMDFLNEAPHAHPGYQEQRKLINGQPPTTFAPVPNLMISVDTIRREDLPSRNEWQQQCLSYFNQYFEVIQSGLAPRNYQIVNPPVPPNTQPTYTIYTYNRCVEDVFNLKAWFFAIGESALLGERIYVHAKWFDAPTDPNEEVINMAGRAAQLHVRYAPYIRGGAMLGQTAILSDNSTLYAWFADYRRFDDAVDLNRIVTEPADLAMGRDFASRGVDKDDFCWVVTSPRIQHMIWQKQFGPGDWRTLYLFANVGNTPQTLRFLYTKGLDLQTDWKKEVRLFDGRDSVGVKFPIVPVHIGDSESFTLAPRSFAAIAIAK